MLMIDSKRKFCAKDGTKKQLPPGWWVSCWFSSKYLIILNTNHLHIVSEESAV